MSEFVEPFAEELRVFTLVMAGPDHSFLLENELVIEEDVYVRNQWVKRVACGWPSRGEHVEECG